MKLTFKTETEILREVELTEDGIKSELIKELDDLFDDKPMKKYEVNFKEGATVGNFNRMKIDNATVLSIIITLA